MYQKRKIRAEKKNNNQEEKLTKVGINWYPGHMAKTKRQIEEDLKLIDVVIEILDARIPEASRNPDIRKLTEGKKKIILLNKVDLADEKESNIWIKKFKESNIEALIVDCNTGKGIDNVIKAVQEIMKEELDKYAQKGRIGRKIRVMVLRNTKCRKIIIYK